MAPTPSTRALVTGASAALLLSLLAGYLVRFRLPAPTGPYPVGTQILFLKDSAHGGRELTVQLWYPAERAGATRARYARWAELPWSRKYLAVVRTDAWLNAPVAGKGAPFPVLLFGHRWGGERTQNTALAEELASRGFVVAATDHPGNSSRTQLQDGRVVRGNEAMDGPEPDSAAARISFWNSTLSRWVADEEFVLNELARLNADPASTLYTRLDTQDAGAFGHSFGGAAALAMMGRDPRVRAAVNLDGYTFAGLAQRSAREPIMILYGEDTGNRRLMPPSAADRSLDGQMDRADAEAVETSLAHFGGTRLYLRGMQHMDFTDLTLLPPWRRPGATGPIAPARADALVRGLVSAFFEQTLLKGPPTDISARALPEAMR